MMLYLLNSCISERSCSKEIPDSPCWPDSNHASFFVNRLNLQVVSADQASLSFWASQEEMFLQSRGCQPHAPTPNLEDQGLFC